jgi:hypothetical protein
MVFVRRFFVLIVVWCIGFAPVIPVFAVQESTNYTVQNGAVGVLGGQASSGSYNLNSGSISPGGSSQGGSFGTQSGAAFSPPTDEVVPPTPGPSGGGGGGGVQDETVPPVLESYRVFHISTNTVRIVYTTNELSVTFAQYSSGATFDRSTPLEMSHATTHEVYLTQLTPGTRYALRFVMRDVAYNTAVSDTVFFTTRSDQTAVPNVSSLSARSTSKQMVLSWNNPVYDQLREIVVLRAGAVMFTGNATSFVDTTVVSGQTYNYTVIVRAQDGRQSSGALLSVAVPLAPVVPTSTPIVPTEPAQEIPQVTPPEIAPTTPIPFPFFGPEKPVFVPAQPPALPQQAQPVIDIKKLSDDVISLYSITTQVTEKQTIKFWQAITTISDASRAAIEQQVGNIFDSVGQIDFSKVVLLPREKIVELETSLNVSIPDVFLKQSGPFAPVEFVPSVPVVSTPTEPGIPVIDTGVEGEVTVAPPERGMVDLVLQEAVVEAPAIPTEQESGGDWHVVAGGDVFVSLPVSLFTQPVQTIIATVGTRAYILSLSADGTAYEARFSAPTEKGEYEMLVQIIYTNNTFDELRNVILVDPSGYVYTEVLRPWSWTRPWEYFMTEEQRLVGASVALYTTVRTGEWAVWPAHLYGQSNPQLSGSDGAYAFIAPPGEYKLVATLDGYDRFEGDSFSVIDIPVTKHIILKTHGVAWEIALRRAVAVIIFGGIPAGWILWRMRKKVIH